MVTTIGAKEGLTHLMWVLLGPGDTAIVPSPSYPIHLAGPGFAGAQVITVPMHDPGLSTNDPGDDFFDGLVAAWEKAPVKPRVIICSFPHNPTSACVDLAFMERLVNFALEREVIVCHDFAYADLGFDGYRPPSILQVPRAKECCVELYTLTKSFSMAGWRVGFMVGNAEIVAALTKLKSYLDYGTFQPVQIAAIVAMNEAPDYPAEICSVYQSRRDVLIDGLARIKDRIKGAVSSSDQSSERLRAHEHAARLVEQVELHEPQRLDVVLVELQHRARAVGRALHDDHRAGGEDARRAEGLEVREHRGVLLVAQPRVVVGARLAVQAGEDGALLGPRGRQWRAHGDSSVR